MTNAIFKFFKLMIITFFAAHWMACLFYTVAVSTSVLNNLIDY